MYLQLLPSSLLGFDRPVNRSSIPLGTGAETQHGPLVKITTRLRGAALIEATSSSNEQIELLAAGCSPTSSDLARRHPPV
jgi:hypothetical protein